METAAANAKYDRLHKDAPFHNGIMGEGGDFTSWSATQSDAHPYHFRDGVRIWVAETDHNPGDRFLG